MKKYYIILPVILSLLSVLFSEEKGALYYFGDLSELNDSTVKVPDEVVALSRHVFVDIGFDTIPHFTTPSIFFIIDHSGSMCYDSGSSNPDYPMDQWGERFKVVASFIDTLSINFPRAEIGVAVFRQHQYFDPYDSSIFVQHPQYPTGAYLPFLKFDSSYALQGGKLGLQILKDFMETDTIIASNDPLAPLECPPDYQYANMKYMPTNYSSNSTGTNINVGFDAAKHAFQSALYVRNRQFIIFLSDGEATIANGPHSNPDDFEAGEGVPTTFTIFFTKQDSVPQSIQTMTDNIQSNGYSSSNSKSKAWDIDPNKQDLMKFIMDSIMTNIIPEFIFMATDLTINGIKVSDFDTVNSCFSFDDHFPLTDVKTDFSYIINYIISKDSILPNGDTIVVIGDLTTTGSFSVLLDSSVSEIPDWYWNLFEIIHWNRNLGFFYKNTPVKSINKGMDFIEIRFTEKEIDILYGYDSVSVTITNSKGNIDSETFYLSKTDSCFTKLFPLAIDSTPTQNDGILQLFDSDTVTAVFRNPKLPLDTLVLSVPFYPTTAIIPDSFINQKTLSLNVINSSILFNLPTSGKTRLQVYNINGRLVSTLVDSYKQAGEYKLKWDNKRFGSGVYFLKLSANGSEVSRKFSNIK